MRSKSGGSIGRTDDPAAKRRFKLGERGLAELDLGSDGFHVAPIFACGGCGPSLAARSGGRTIRPRRDASSSASAAWLSSISAVTGFTLPQSSLVGDAVQVWRLAREDGRSGREETLQARRARPG